MEEEKEEKALPTLREGTVKNGYRGQEWIYYCDDDRGRIKIGYSLYPWGRVAEFKTVNPEIQMLVCESGERELEKIRHQQFEEERIGGEWFCKSERLQEWIDFLCAAARIEENLSGAMVGRPDGVDWFDSENANNSGSGAPPAQSHPLSRQKKWRAKNREHLRDYMRLYRAKKQQEK